MYTPSSKHVSQVAEISEVIVKAFLLAFNEGATGVACCDAALSSFLAIVNVFGKEQQTIDALPYIRQLLEHQMQERMLSQTEPRDGGTVH